MTHQVVTAIRSLPEQLQKSVQLSWQQFQAVVTELEGDFSLHGDVAQSLPTVWACSEVVTRWCIRNPAWLQELIETGCLRSSYTAEQYQSELKEILFSVEVEDEASLMCVLRKFRNQHMLRLIWRDIAGWTDLQTTMSELSALAETCIDEALQTLSDWLYQTLGKPCNARGELQQLVVIAMGKLGAWELNISSDVDLIFVFDEEGRTQGGPKQLSNSEFFIRLGQKLISVLNKTTEDGFVFRVDMRLRPFGDSGALASSFTGMENYYQIHGREWERYAMIKARVVAGDKQVGEQLMNMLRPFVYRRYMDYGAYESMREMKAMIVREVKRKGMEGNIKLGAGGIREVEFITQVFQLIRGGRNTQFQERRLLKVLAVIAEEKLLPEYVVDELKQAYIFLRNTEHRLQEYLDQQTHELPTDTLGQLRLACAMGFTGWDRFKAELDHYRVQVHSHFEQVFAAPQTETSPEHEQLITIWTLQVTDEQAETILSAYGYRDTSEVLRQLQAMRESRAFQTRTTQGQKRLNLLMPLLIGAVGKSSQPEKTLQRVIELLVHIARRSVYMVLLTENPLALSQLVKLCDQSAWIARYISQYPILLDELLDPRSLYLPPQRYSLDAECRQKLASIQGQDNYDEQYADTLRHFKHTNVLRVAAADLADALPVMKVSDHLTWIAEIVLEYTLEQAWQYQLQRHGRPVCNSDGQICDKGFAIIGYGKLGGIELGYGSDLDLVFLHGAESENMMTHTNENQQQKPVANSMFFARLGQRLIHLLTAHTSAGVLYETDMRLRPNGASGMLVSNLKAYEKYQSQKAWVWEHQALVRARPIAGDPVIAEQFSQIRKKILCQSRDRDALIQQVNEMRKKMRGALNRDSENRFDLKQGYGGIVDIEFLVQFSVLAWAHRYPELVRYTDNIRILQSLAATGCMPDDDVEKLSEAYRTYRACLHRMALQAQSGLVSADEYLPLRQQISRIWQSWLG